MIRKPSLIELVEAMLEVGEFYTSSIEIDTYLADHPILGPGCPCGEELESELRRALQEAKAASNQ